MAGHPRTPFGHHRCYLSVLAGFTAVRSQDPTITSTCHFRKERRRRDSNPRYLTVHTISSRAPSTTRSPLQEGNGEGGIRTLGRQGLQQISSLSPSTTRPPLRIIVFSDVIRGRTLAATLLILLSEPLQSPQNDGSTGHLHPDFQACRDIPLLDPGLPTHIV